MEIKTFQTTSDNFGNKIEELKKDGWAIISHVEIDNPIRIDRQGRKLGGTIINIIAERARQKKQMMMRPLNPFTLKEI